MAMRINTKCVRIIAALVALTLISSSTHAQNLAPKLPATEYLFYRREGGLSAFNWIEVSIQNDGHSKVSYERQNDKAITVRLMLSPSEMQALKTRIRAAGEVDLPADNAIPENDAGRTILRLTRGGSVVQWSFAHHEPLEPTTQFVNMMFNQAVILHDLENKDDAYAALGAVSDSLVMRKVLQPAALEAPLRALVHRSNDMQKLSQALQALSNLVSPDELMGMFTTELETAAPERKITLLHSLCYGGPGLSPDHRRALIPLSSLELRSVSATLPELPAYSKQVYADLIRFLGRQRDAQAVPVLILIAEAEAEPTLANQGTRELARVALAETGYSAIAPLVALLDHKSAAVRCFAAETFGLMLTISPHGRPAYERQQMISYLKQMIPRFELLARSDADAKVRQAAAKAIQLMQAE
jgi:hypothetical protein